MDISQRSVDGVIVLSVSGQITLSKGGDAKLHDRIRTVVLEGGRQIVVDLAGVNYMDSAGLGELVHAHATVANQGGVLKLANPTKRLKDLLTITKLVTVFDCFDTEADAIASFKK